MENADSSFQKAQKPHKPKKDWRPAKLIGLRHTLMRKANFFHKRSNAQVYLAIKMKNRYYVYTSARRPSPEAIQKTDRYNQKKRKWPEFPPPLHHIRRTLRKRVWYGDDLEGIPYARQFVATTRGQGAMNVDTALSARQFYSTGLPMYPEPPGHISHGVAPSQPHQPVQIDAGQISSRDGPGDAPQEEAAEQDNSGNDSECEVDDTASSIDPACRDDDTDPASEDELEPRYAGLRPSSIDPHCCDDYAGSTDESDSEESEADEDDEDDTSSVGLECSDDDDACASRDVFSQPAKQTWPYSTPVAAAHVPEVGLRHFDRSQQRLHATGSPDPKHHRRHNGFRATRDLARALIDELESYPSPPTTDRRAPQGRAGLSRSLDAILAAGSQRSRHGQQARPHRRHRQEVTVREPNLLPSVDIQRVIPMDKPSGRNSQPSTSTPLSPVRDLTTGSSSEPTQRRLRRPGRPRSTGYKNSHGASKEVATNGPSTTTHKVSSADKVYVHPSPPGPYFAVIDEVSSSSSTQTSGTSLPMQRSRRFANAR